MKTEEITQPENGVEAAVNHPKPHVTAQDYAEMYAASVQDPDTFWAEQGKRLDWIKPFTKVKNTSFEPGNHSDLFGKN